MTAQPRAHLEVVLGVLATVLAEAPPQLRELRDVQRRRVRSGAAIAAQRRAGRAHLHFAVSGRVLRNPPLRQRGLILLLQRLVRCHEGNEMRCVRCGRARPPGARATRCALPPGARRPTARGGGSD